ncbi:MAG: YmaF family protein [Methylocystaceae bacterium]
MALTHVHEYEGSVRVVENHNHRFAGVTGQAIASGTSHVHRLAGRTDFYEDHFHLQNRLTGPAIPVGAGRYVHFIANGLTTVADGHQHPYRVATLIDDPIGES